jgi:6-phosphogluconolactonase
MGQAEIIPCVSDDALAAAAAEAWWAELNAADARGSKYFVALSGGRITRKLFGQMVERCHLRTEVMRCAHFFWADERCLPPDDAESNFRLAQELLFAPLSISTDQIHRIHGEAPPDAGARLATEELRALTGADGRMLPGLDLVMLGMGEDGHVASLFPGDATTGGDLTSVFLPVYNSPKPPPNRISLGHGVIAAAREVWVLVSGQAKEAALRESLSPQGRTPLAAVIRGRKTTRIYSDVSLT